LTPPSGSVTLAGDPARGGRAEPPDAPGGADEPEGVAPPPAAMSTRRWLRWPDPAWRSSRRMRAAARPAGVPGTGGAVVHRGRCPGTPGGRPATGRWRAAAGRSVGRG